MNCILKCIILYIENNVNIKNRLKLAVLIGSLGFVFRANCAKMIKGGKYMTKTIEEMEEIKEKLSPIFKKRQVALAYLFGSHANGRVTPLSDVDIAVVFSDKASKK